MKLENPASEIREKRYPHFPFLLTLIVFLMSLLSCFCVCVCNLFSLIFFFFFFGSVWSSLLHGFFSSCSEQGCTGFSSCNAQGCHCSDFSRGAGALGTRASVVVARGLESTGSVVVMHRLNCYVESSTSSIETVSPPLAGRFFNAEPSGKPCVCNLQMICI